MMDDSEEEKITNGFATPMESINHMKGKEVVVLLRSGKKVEGTLVAFDLQQNVGIKVRGELVFIQGGTTLSVSLK